MKRKIKPFKISQKKLNQYHNILNDFTDLPIFLKAWQFCSKDKIALIAEKLKWFDYFVGKYNTHLITEFIVKKRPDIFKGCKEISEKIENIYSLKEKGMLDFLELCCQLDDLIHVAIKYFELGEDAYKCWISSFTSKINGGKNRIKAEKKDKEKFLIFKKRWDDGYYDFDVGYDDIIIHIEEDIGICEKKAQYFHSMACKDRKRLKRKPLPIDIENK